MIKTIGEYLISLDFLLSTAVYFFQVQTYYPHTFTHHSHPKVKVKRHPLSPLTCTQRLNLCIDVLSFIMAEARGVAPG